MNCSKLFPDKRKTERRTENPQRIKQGQIFFAMKHPTPIFAKKISTLVRRVIFNRMVPGSQLQITPGDVKATWRFAVRPTGGCVGG